jgi:phosphoserine phosphatase
MASRFNPGALALLETHLAAGHQVFLATAAPVELAAIIAGRLRLSGALGTVCERSEGRFTGRLVSPLLHGPAKAHAVAALIARERLNPHSCYAYSDSVNDLPMLSLVGYPAAINPDRQLRRIANDRYWPIHDSRRRRFWPSSAKTLACSGAPTIYAHPAETAGLSVITGTKP